jgi:hypothetical protein
MLVVCHETAEQAKRDGSEKEKQVSIKITPALLSDLRQKAEAAGGRPWEVQNRRWTMRSPHYHIAVVDDYWQDEAELLIAETIGGKGQKVWANANHMAAANPAVVLALLAEVERLRDRLDDIICSGCNQQPKFCVCDIQLEASDADQA